MILLVALEVFILGTAPWYLRPERPDCKRVSVSFDKDLLADLDAAAIKMGCTRSGLLNMVAYYYIRDLQSWQGRRIFDGSQNSESSDPPFVQSVS